jgi:MauM/NapG family ferredoxin protein
MLTRTRRIVQGLFLALFLFLFIQTESKGLDELGYPVKLFLDFDPLIFVTTLLASRAVEGLFWLSLIVVGLTVVLGRFFCGWVCPLGTLNNLAGSLRKKRTKPPGAGWFRLKYYILVFILASSVFGAQLAGIADPISLTIRSLSLAVYPALSYAATSFFDGIYRLNLPGVTPASEILYDLLKKSVLPFQQPWFLQGVFLGALFLAILGLNLVQRRFWCRFLCPLGALLGLMSRYAILRREVSEECDSCGACAGVCQADAVPDGKEKWRASECLACNNCDDICPKNAVSFGFLKGRPTGGLDLGRRNIVTSFLSGAFAVPLLRISPLSRPRMADAKLIRPPGALEEPKFLQTCVRCGECMKVCITGGLQPTLLEAGLEGIWTPVLVPRIGFCEFRCTLCSQVCPTGAIKRLPLEEKQEVRLGHAAIDKGRCLPFAHATPCIVCEETCPTPQKAIWVEEVTVRDREGNPVRLQQPHVDLTKCIGCGACEKHCPVADQPAIYVTSSGESRSGENQLLLQSPTGSPSK